MQNQTSIGAIRVPWMIKLAVFLTLASLYICYAHCDLENPTILETTLEYPYTIIFRVCMLYSLFIFFLQILFIKWWIDSAYSSGKHTRFILVLGTVGLLAYGLFVSCIDRKRINFPLTRGCANVANICMTLVMYLIMHNLRKIRKVEPGFIKPRSWTYKIIACGFHLAGFTGGLLMYLGYLDIDNKPIIEYTIVLSTTMFLWTFAKDFKKFKMDIDVPEEEQITNQPQINHNYIHNPNFGYTSQDRTRPSAVNLY